MGIDSNEREIAFCVYKNSVDHYARGSRGREII